MVDDREAVLAKAIVDRMQNKSLVYIGNLCMEIVEEADGVHPVGRNGSGIAFWDTKMTVVDKRKGTITTGQGDLINAFKSERDVAEAVRGELHGTD